MATLSEKQAEFLGHPYYGVVTTVREDGSPQSSVVWVGIRDGYPAFNTAYGRAKPANMERDPRISMLILDPSDGYRWVLVEGRARLTTEGADQHIDSLAKKYLDADTYPFRKEDEQRVTVLIEPTRIEAHGIEEEH